MKTKNFSIRNSLLAIGCFAFGTAAMTGCSKSLDTNYTEQQNVAVAGLMAFNLTTDKTVGVAISGNSLGNPLGFSNYTGDYVRIYAGTRTFEARDGYGGNSLAITPYTFDSSRYYSAFVLGTGGAYKNVLVNDNFDSLSGSNGKAYVRYINAVPDSTHAATVSISTNGTNISSATATYGAVSQFTAVTPGQVTFAINKNGIAKNRTIDLEQQKVYTVLLLDVPNTNTTDSMQVRFVINGTLSGTSTNGRATAPNTKVVSVN